MFSVLDEKLRSYRTQKNTDSTLRAAGIFLCAKTVYSADAGLLQGSLKVYRVYTTLFHAANS